MEMLLVAVIGLLLFGGKGLPDMARTLGKIVREFKKASAQVENEVKRVMDEEPDDRPRRAARRPRPTAPRPAITAPPDDATVAAPPPPAAVTPAHRIPPPEGPGHV